MSAKCFNIHIFFNHPDEVLNTKNENEDKKIIDLSQLIMEKLKFLNDGKPAVTSVQVMAIQVEVCNNLFRNLNNVLNLLKLIVNSWAFSQSIERLFV